MSHLIRFILMCTVEGLNVLSQKKKALFSEADQAGMNTG